MVLPVVLMVVRLVVLMAVMVAVMVAVMLAVMVVVVLSLTVGHRRERPWVTRNGACLKFGQIQALFCAVSKQDRPLRASGGGART